jgi:hypothetical protein
VHCDNAGSNGVAANAGNARSIGGMGDGTAHSFATHSEDGGLGVVGGKDGPAQLHCRHLQPDF